MFFLIKYRKIGFSIRFFIQLDEIKENIEKETFNLENGLDDLRNIITPKQIGKFLLEVEKVSKLKNIIKNSFS